MVIKILGGIDVIAGLILIFIGLVNYPIPLLTLVGIAMLIKASFILLKDFASWLDLIAGIILLIEIPMNVSGFIGIIIGILILQKGIFSFL
jgi:hypothetical protein